MQEYTKIKVASKDDGKRFYRIIGIKGNPDLYTLGAYIGQTIGAWFEHMYLFHVGKKQYVADSWLEEGFFSEEYSLGECHLSDLGKKFVYEYDTGEGWEFDCSVYEKPYIYNDEYFEEDGYPDCIVIEGKGQGIFENDHGTLCRYLDGEIDPESSEENEELFQFLPMNLDLKKYGDFDNELDVEDMQYFEEEVADIVANMKGEIDTSYKDYLANDFEEDDDFSDCECEDDDEIDLDDLISVTVASDIFNDEKINKAFRRLIKTYDINDAYDMICDCFAEAILEGKDEDDPKFTDELYFEKIKHLK